MDDDVFEKDFQAWLDDYEDLPMAKKELDAFIAEREAKRAARKAKKEGE